MSYLSGGHLLVQVLREAGVDTVFGVVSVHNLPLVEAVSAQLRFVPVRHEASAVNAADGYARARGGLGCALTSTGTGAGNAAGSLIESLSAGTSVLHVTGQIESAYLGSGRGFIHETKDQIGMLRAVSHEAVSITSVDSAGPMLRAAVRRCLSRPGGPVSVEWPIDLQYRRHPENHPQSAAAVRPSPSPAPIGDDDLARVCPLLGKAERPLVWAGGGATAAGEPLGRLVRRLGAGLLTSNSGRGAVREDHPLCIGNYAASPIGQELLGEADLLLSIGTHFRSNETRDYRLRIPPVHIQVDLDPAAVGRAYPVEAGVVADAREFLEAVLAQLPQVGRRAWALHVAEVKARVREWHRNALGEHAAFADVLRDVLPDRAVIARDVTIASSAWGNRLLEIYDPRDNIFPRGGGIGQGLGMGIGAALARPGQPTVVIVGDGGLAVHLGELLTVAQERPHLVLLVFNDGGYGVLRNMQDAQGGPRAGVDLHAPDFELLAGAVGLPYRVIAHAEQLKGVLADAVAHGGPVLIEIDLGSFGEMPSPFTPPVSVPTTEVLTKEQT